MQGLGAKIDQNGNFAKFSCCENFMFYSTCSGLKLELNDVPTLLISIF